MKLESKSKIQFLLVIFLSPWMLQAQSNITVKDAAEISYKSELLINEFKDLLNIISNTETNLKESKDLISNSHSGTRNKIFSGPAISIEDDLSPNENRLARHREKPIEKYLNDVDLLYQKSDSPSVIFNNIHTSNVKRGDYLYIKVYYNSLFRNKPVSTDTPYFTTNRVAEIRVNKEKNKWNLQIMRVAFFIPSDTVKDTKNDVALTLPKDDSRGKSTETVSTNSSGQAFAEDLKMQERARQVEEFMKERDQYNKLIEKGDQLLQANDLAAALKAFSEAAELSPYEIYPKLKLNQIRKNVDQAAISDDEIYKQYMLKGQIAEKERKYEEAKEDYTVALAKKPLEASALEETIRRLTAKLHTMTVLEEKYDAGQYKEAVKDYDKAIKKDNKNSDFFLGRGKCYDKLGDYSKTMRDYTSAIDLDNNNLQAWKLRAALYASKGDYIKALGDYKISTTINKTDTAVFFKMFDLHSLTGNLSSAEEDLNKVIAIDPKIASAYYKRGLLFSRRENIPHALDDFSTAIKADPGYSAAFYQRGLCNVKLRRISQAGEDFANARKSGLDEPSLKNVSTIAKQYYTEGVDQFTKHAMDSSLHLFNTAILIDPYVAEYRFKRGEYYFLVKDYAAAMSNYTDAIQLKENYYDAWYKRGCTKFNQRNYEQAIPDLEMAIRINPKIPDTYKILADAYSRAGRYAQAIQQYDLAIQIAKTNKVVLDESLLTDLYNNQGESYFNTMDYRRAVEALKNAVRYSKNNGKAYFNRGYAYFKLNQLKDAEDDLQKALSFQPAIALWCNILGEVYQQEGQYENAVGQFSKAIALDSSGQIAGQAYYHRGFCYAQLSDFNQALPDYLISGNYTAGNDEPHSFRMELGYIYLQLGNSDSAQAQYQEILRQDSSDAQAWYGLAVVYVQKNQFDQALPHFERAFGYRTIKYATVKKDKLIEGIRDDTRYKSLIKKYF